MALAERGDLAKVSTTAEECQQELNEASYFDNFPKHAVVHAFGNTLKPDYKGTLCNRLSSCWPTLLCFSTVNYHNSESAYF